MVQESDLKFPMVYGEGKRSRLLATIGVTRGFGDHDLRAQSQLGTIYIKPFLSPQPEVSTHWSPALNETNLEFFILLNFLFLEPQFHST